MLHRWKTIAVLMDATPQGERVARHAAALARRCDAYLIGVFGVARDPIHPADAYARGEGVKEVARRLLLADDRKAAEASARLAELVLEYDIRCEFRVAWRDSLGEDVLRRLDCDLIVAAYPKPRDLPPGWSAETLLLAGGVPILLIPDSWTNDHIGDRVMIAWNGSRKALRAVNDAMPLLEAAQRVTILVVDGDKDPERYGAVPGVDVKAHLTHHDIAAEVLAVASGDASVAETIAAKAAELDADLTVLGAYSHSRAAEAIFGGVTRALLAHAPRPLLISN